MAQHQRKIDPKLKRLLIERAGNKCANPGCSNWRVHIHHIKHWAIYKTHFAEHMIAICPSCHDAVHYGRLKIPDELLSEWKSINRPVTPHNAHIYIEPSASLRLLTGTISIATTNQQLIIFDLSNYSQLKFRVLDQDILQVSSKLLDQNGNELVRVVDNHVRSGKDKRIQFDYHSGRCRITVPIAEDIVPRWIVDQMRIRDPHFAADGRIVAIDLQVLRPGLIKVQGCWTDGNVGIVITDSAFSLLRREHEKIISFVGDGERSVLMYTGPITLAFFGFS